MDQQLSVQTLRQLLNVHMEFKESISKQLISYSIIKCSCLLTGTAVFSNTCILEYTDIWRKTMKFI